MLTKESTQRPEMFGVPVAKTILVVDDERALADTLCAILIHAGYRVLCVYSAEEAIEVLRAHRVDLMISDVVMPGMNGFELAVHATQNYPGTQILLLSGNAATQEIIAAPGAEQHHFELWAKPVLPRQMLAHIESLFASSSQ
jgi:CheY-like chemotaxis protein